MIDDAPIDLLRHAIVVTAVSRLHVKNRYVEPLGYQRAQAAVGIAQYQQAIGPFSGQYCLRPLQNCSHLRSEGIALCRQIMVRRTHPQLIEKDVAELRLEVLSGMDQYMVAEPVQPFDDPAQTDDLRSGAEHRRDLHLRNSPSS